jgi:hypothetical protein
VTLDGDELVVWRAAREGRRVLERPPLVRAPLAGGDGVSHELLGAVPRRGSPPELLVVSVPEEGPSRLVRLTWRER